MDGKALLDSTISMFAHDYASAIEYICGTNNEADSLEKQASGAIENTIAATGAESDFCSSAQFAP